MTTRRLLAVFTLFALLFTFMPEMVEADDDHPYRFPGFVRAFTVPGNDARWAGTHLLVTDDRPLLTMYDRTTGALEGTIPLDAPAIRIESSSRLLVLTAKGTLYCYGWSYPEYKLELQWQRALSGGQKVSREQAALLLLGDWGNRSSEILVSVGNQVSRLNPYDGSVQWQTTLPGEANVIDVREIDTAYGVIIHYQNAEGSFNLVLYEWEEWVTLPASPAVVGNTFSGTFHYVAPDGHEVHEVNLILGTDTPLFTTADPVKHITGDSGLTITTGTLGLRWSQDAVDGWYSDGGESNSSYQLGMDNYLMVSQRSIALFEGNALNWATELPEGDASTAVLQDVMMGGFILKLNANTIASYVTAENYFNFRKLHLSQGQSYQLDHPVAGTVSFDLTQSRIDPYRDLRYTVSYQAAGGDEWTRLAQDYLDGFVRTLSIPGVPAGKVKIALAAARRGDFNPELLPTSDSEAQRPIRFGITLREGLTGSLAAPPLLQGVNPALHIHDLWNNTDATSIDWQIKTEPNGMVDFYGLEHLVQADANGNLTQTVPIGENNGIQAIATDAKGAQSAVTVYVRRHLIKADPRVAPLLARQPAIAVEVPDASAVDLEQSVMLVDGVRVPLHADLRQNRIYGVPASSLPTGARQVKLVLCGPAGADGSPAPILDFAEWPVEIIGDRVAVLWLNKTNSLMNGQTVKLDASPYLNRQAATTMIPFRYVGDVMGAQVGWNSQTKEVSFKLKDRTVLLTIGSRTAFVDGKAVTMLTSPTLSNGRTLVPLRFVSEQLGAKVDWNGSKQEITISVAADPGE